MQYARKTPKETLERLWRLERTLRVDQLKAIQEAMCGFLMDEVIAPTGEYYCDCNMVYSTDSSTVQQ